MGAAAERSRETLERAAPNKHTGLKSCPKNCLKVSKVAHEEGKMNIKHWHKVGQGVHCRV